MENCEQIMKDDCNHVTEEVILKSPTQCSLWNKEQITPEDLNFQSVNVFVNKNLIKRDLFKCRECGQLYFHEWYEHINFRRSAHMYDTYIPVQTKEEVDKLLGTRSSADLMKFIPQLHGSYLGNEEDSMRWIRSSSEWEK